MVSVDVKFNVVVANVKSVPDVAVPPNFNATSTLVGKDAGFLYFTATVTDGPLSAIEYEVALNKNTGAVKSSSIIEIVETESAPIKAPFVALPKPKIKVSFPSTNMSFVIGMVIVFMVSSAVNVRVTVENVKSVPVVAEPPVFRTTSIFVELNDGFLYLTPTITLVPFSFTE